MDIVFDCNKCGQSITIDEAGAGQLIDCPKCGNPVEVPYKSMPLGQSATRKQDAPPPVCSPKTDLTRFEYTVCALQLEKEVLAWSRSDILQGLSAKSASRLTTLGNDGWELVSVIPFTAGGVGIFSNASTGTNGALAFFKRAQFTT